MGCGGSKSKPDAKTPSRQDSKKEKAKTGDKSTRGSDKTSSKRRNLRDITNDVTNDVTPTSPRKPPKGARRHSQLSRRTVTSEAHHSNFVPYEAENLVLEGNWEIEKGVDDETLTMDNSYPVPKYGKPVSEKINFSHVDFDIMKTSDLKQATGSFEEVAKSLTQSFQSDILKVRALTTWMCTQKIRTRQYGAEAKPGTVLGYMKRIKEQTGTFAGLLTNLCRAIEIPCVIVKGIYKSFMHRVGEDDLRESRSTWCAVHVDGSWQLVHPYLICTPLCSTTLTDGWKLLETSKSDAKQNSGCVLNTFFFAPKPADFLHCCIPDEINSYWQLLEPRTHYNRFLKLPFLRPAFFSNKMALTTEQKSVIMCHNGRANFKMKSDIDTASKTEMMYELYSLDADLEMDKEWGDVVLCARNEDTWIVQIKFPLDGTFKLALYGRISDWIFWLGDFKIICDVPVTPFVPWPVVPKEVGWGPCKLTESAGLLAPSHQGGIVFYKPNEEHVLKFLVNEKLRTKCEIEHPLYETEDLKKYCRTVPRKCEIDFTVTLPLGGEFAVRIYLVADNEDSTNVCNYLFTDWEDGRPRENLFQRKARWNLREAVVGHDIAVLETCLKKFTSVKLEEDDDHLRGQRRLRYLRLKKGLRDGRMRLHEQTLAQAIGDAESSQFKEALQPNIDKATSVLDSLQSMEMHCHPVLAMDAQTIAEIANFSNPPRDVHKTMIATYLLLGEERKSLQKWGYIQGLLRRQGREGIKYRVDQFRKNESTMPDSATLETVRQIHSSIPKEYILSASLSATTFYDWVSGVLSCVSNYSQNANDTDDIYDTDDDLNDEHRRTHKKRNNRDAETISQDEGFLDSQDMEHSTRNNTDLH